MLNAKNAKDSFSVNPWRSLCLRGKEPHPRPLSIAMERGDVQPGMAGIDHDASLPFSIAMERGVRRSGRGEVVHPSRPQIGQ
jgi:hypothetical protein